MVFANRSSNREYAVTAAGGHLKTGSEVVATAAHDGAADEPLHSVQEKAKTTVGEVKENAA